MTRRTRTLAVMTAAVGMAGLASFSVYRAVKQQPVRQIETPSMYVIVAAKPLDMGIQLTAAQVKLIAWPAHSPVTGGFTSIDRVVGRGLVMAVGENEPITERKLAPREAGAGLPPAITPGMRAVSIKIDDVIGVSGFVTPGTRVDVLVTLREQRNSMARVVVSNAQVLTTGTEYQDEPEGTNRRSLLPPTVVTVMVSPADAERVALASSEGTIVLALRNPLDTEPTLSTGVRSGDLMGAPAPAAPVPAVERAVVRRVDVPRPTPIADVRRPAPASGITTVETIRAGKREQQVVAPVAAAEVVPQQQAKVEPR